MSTNTSPEKSLGQIAYEKWPNCPCRWEDASLSYTSAFDGIAKAVEATVLSRQRNANGGLGDDESEGIIIDAFNSEGGVQKAFLRIGRKLLAHGRAATPAQGSVGELTPDEFEAIMKAYWDDPSDSAGGVKAAFAKYNELRPPSAPSIPVVHRTAERAPAVEDNANTYLYGFQVSSGKWCPASCYQIASARAEYSHWFALILPPAPPSEASAQDRQFEEALWSCLDPIPPTKEQRELARKMFNAGAATKGAAKA